jgi:threonine dehydrogenase-like Zn-dependent dehydrogenase
MTPTMRAVWMERGDVSVRGDVPRPQPAEGISRVRVVRAGVCATDLALKGGYMGFAGVPGHEFVGVALDGPLAGQRVVGEINAACGLCPWCQRGDDRHCPSRTVLGIQAHSGAFAEELALPHRNLLAVPDGVGDDAATFTEPLAAALHIADDVEVAGANTLVIGDGRLGLLCAWALHLRGAARVEVAGRHPERADLLPPAAVLVGEADPSSPWQGERRDVVVEVTGRGALLEHAVARTRPRGTLVLKTTAADTTPVNLWQVVVDEIRLVGSRCGRFAPALEALASGQIPTDRFVMDRFTLDDAPAALDRAAERGVLKVLLDVER